MCLALPSANLSCRVSSVWAAGPTGVGLSQPCSLAQPGLCTAAGASSPSRPGGSKYPLLSRQLLPGLPVKGCCFFSETSFSGVHFLAFYLESLQNMQKQNGEQTQPCHPPSISVPRGGPCAWPPSFSFSSVFGAVALSCVTVLRTSVCTSGARGHLLAWHYSHRIRNPLLSSNTRDVLEFALLPKVPVNTQCIQIGLQTQSAHCTWP